MIAPSILVDFPQLLVDLFRSLTRSRSHTSRVIDPTNPIHLSLTHALSISMGGGSRFPFPKFVWSPAGGWWTDAPPNRVRNLRLLMAGAFVFVVTPAVLFCSAREVRDTCKAKRSRRRMPPLESAVRSRSCLLAIDWSLLQRRNVPLKPIPSQRWYKHALEDDPEYPQKLEAYQRSRESLWARILP